MNEKKFEILFETHNAEFEKVINAHCTTLTRLTSGEDKFPYSDVNIIARRQFTGFLDMEGNEIYEGDKMLSVHDDGDRIYIGVVMWFAEWAGWAIVDNGIPETFGTKESSVAEYRVEELLISGRDLSIFE